jgi:hypothetical protein
MKGWGQGWGVGAGLGGGGCGQGLCDEEDKKVVKEHYRRQRSEGIIVATLWNRFSSFLQPTSPLTTIHSFICGVRNFFWGVRRELSLRG